ncbi:MAG TPA: FKBP-type peptidyl-prolyl cis-trans isomerase [Acidothermaceae bacterium]
MAGKDRKRQIARERYEKRMAARAEARVKAKRRTAIGLSAGGVIAIVGIVLLFTLPSNNKKPASSLSPVSSASASTSPSAAASSPIPPIPTTASGCTSKPSVVASPIANFPLLPAGVDPALKTEPIVTVPAGPVPTKTEVKDIVVGTGATVGAHDSVTVNYLGLNYVDCSEFDSSWSRDTPATFSLDGVVPGFSKGIGGDSASGIAPMKVGGRREIIVTPADGYSTTGSGAIKPNEELVFVVDVLAASAPSPSPSASGSGSPSVTPSTSPAASVTPSPTAATSS